MMSHLRRDVVAVVCIVWMAFCAIANGRTRNYYIGAIEVQWDFAPSGRDLVRPDSSNADVFIARTKSKIGSVYKKAVYRRFTDHTFTQRNNHPDWMGILGPVIIGQVGDTLVITFKNLASRPFSMHPHGVRYDKRSEGAYYKDGTDGVYKADDSVDPGSTHVYIWNVTSQTGPTDDDPNCVTWVYHSHNYPAKDTNSGLIGPLVTCKKGSIDENGDRLDGSTDRYLLFKVFDESLSWYMAENLNKCLDPALCLRLHKTKDEDFKESNLMHSINGYVYGNMPHVVVCGGARVNWHLMGLGTDVDMHTVIFNGQTMVYHKHRVQSLGLFPAELKTASMRVTSQPGVWMIYCQVIDHYSAGMQTFMNVKSCGVRPSVKSPSAVTRTYFIAAEEVIWNYAPSGLNGHTGESLNTTGRPSFKFFQKSPTRIGGLYKKVRYFAYTDATFTRHLSVPARHQHFGILGPLIRVEIGDKIQVVFKNMATHNFSITTSSLPVETADDIAPHLDNVTYYGVAPGQKQSYIWSVPSSAGPTSSDENCVPSFYFSSVKLIRDISSGLVGPLLVCRPGTIKADGSLRNGELEFFLVASITDENLSAYIGENMAQLAGHVSAEDKDFQTSNKMNNINGLSYDNLPGLSMCVKDRVVWYMLGLGTESGVHTLHFYGNTFVRWHNRGQTVSLFPGIARTVTMVADNPGRWTLISYTNDHLMHGLSATYTVRMCKASPAQRPIGPLRRFYIAAVEIEWDYAPIKDKLGKMPATNPNSTRYPYVRNDTGYIGSVYRKAVYKQFTGGTFTNQKQDGGDVHLGLVGPTLHVEVGDEVEIVFKNMASRPFSLHPQGLLYDSANAGSSFSTPNSGVRPGGLFVYRWYVPERSGPASDDTNCVPWPYISAVDPVRDTSSGLFGTFVVCRKGILVGNRKQRTDDINREFVLYFHVVDENLSWYIDQNIAKYAPERVDDDDFRESNRYYSINGGLFGNTRGLTMYTGEHVAWYIIGLGNQIDIHSVHFHGQTAVARISGAHALDVISVFPGTAETIVMAADNPGRWLLHCHLNNHLMHGMETTYDVIRRKEIDTTPNTSPAVSTDFLTLLSWIIGFYFF